MLARRRFRLALLSLSALAGACGHEARQEGRPAAPPSPSSQGAARAPEPGPPTAGSSRAGVGSLEVRYLALGDSFTIGTGSTPEESFPARLSARFRERKRSVTLKNLGVNGYATSDVLALEIPQIRLFEPTLVTVAVGANDIVRGRSAERYRENVRRIFEKILEQGVPAGSIYALPQPDWSLSKVGGEFGMPVDVIARQIDLFNSILREEAARAGAHYV